MRGTTSIIGNFPIALSRNNEMHCKVCSPNFYDFKFYITFSPIFIIATYLFSATTDSLKSLNDYFSEWLNYIIFQLLVKTLLAFF